MDLATGILNSSIFNSKKHCVAAELLKKSLQNLNDMNILEQVFVPNQD